MGKGALGKWWALTMIAARTLSRLSGGYLVRCRAGDITCMPRGVCRQVLKLRTAWEGSPGKAAAANRTREIRPSGMRGGLAETWAMVELGTRCTFRKGAGRKLSA